MGKSRLQFSLAALFLTIATVGAVLALMFQVPLEIARPTLVALVPAASALAITGLVYGDATTRPFCIGAIVPTCASGAWRTGFCSSSLADRPHASPEQ